MARITPRRLGRLPWFCLAVFAPSLACVPAHGRVLPFPKLTVEQEKAMRYPQPVQVGSLRGEPVIQRGEHLKTLGHVVGVFQLTGGGLELVFRSTGVFGYSARTVAPPLGATSLVGPMVKIADLDQKQLDALPTFTGRGGAFLHSEDIIRMGVDRKY